ncbi:hypothetical protein [Algibacter sp. L4_22]|uniref:hypothetical protein n=1 Tax=Algibacter sp. L4_22 TaxID=2942477 RepID=UPI00201B8240|nr:hypothetical protein [Algibacter sp. L4_22]MCL5127261.1 hypothetical protein [Algibacter sp. L4_22]
MKNFLLIVFVIVVYSCSFGQKSISEKKEKNVVKEVFSDSIYVLNNEYAIGDARRYGVTAKTAKLQHPNTGKNRIASVLDLAEQSGLEISFPSGYYGMDLTLDSRKNLNLKFNRSEFSLIHITQRKKEDEIPENIRLKGTLISYDRLGITEAKNITIDTVYLKTDVTKSLRNMRNRGCHIYHGCSNIKINYLEIDDFGSGDASYQYNHAAVAIDGYSNNPDNIVISKVYIKSSDRHGVYMTGTDNTIKELIIDSFGTGSSEFMSGMQDANNKAGENKEFTALWMNKCDYCYVDKVTINEAGSRGVNTVFLDAGDPLKKSEVSKLIILNDNSKMGVKKDANTNIVIVNTKISN